MVCEYRATGPAKMEKGEGSMGAERWASGRILGLVTACGLITGCASTPQKTLTTLNTIDPKFNSPACLDIRSRAVTYDDKTGERAASGLLLGVFLGPFGIPIAAAIDAKQNEDRYAFNREITLRCVTGGEEIVARQDAERNNTAPAQSPQGQRGG
jgi:hypothetical protein